MPTVMANGTAKRSDPILHSLRRSMSFKTCWASSLASADAPASAAPAVNEAYACIPQSSRVSETAASDEAVRSNRLASAPADSERLRQASRTRFLESYFLPEEAGQRLTPFSGRTMTIADILCCFGNIRPMP
jgi:hypothetical protein